MSSAEVKLQLFRLIDETNDTSLLDKAYSALSKIFSKKESDWWDTISAEEKIAIEEGIAQADRGEVLPLSKIISQGRTIYKK